MFSHQHIPTITLEARRPGGAWGTRNRMGAENDAMREPESSRRHMSVAAVKAATAQKMQYWIQAVRDDTEYRVAVR